jgi:hypothetical protein
MIYDFARLYWREERRKEGILNPEVVRGRGAEENCMADCCVLYVYSM